MLSIFTLTVLGAFGASNALTDVSDRSDDDDDLNRDEDDHEGGHASLGGETDLIARLDDYAAARMPDAVSTPTSEAVLPAESAETSSAAGMPHGDLLDDDFWDGLDDDELDLLAGQYLPATDLGEVDTGEPDRIIPVSIGAPGVDASDPAEAGFRTSLGPDDELTLNIAPDLPGSILAVHSVHDTAGADGLSVGLHYTLNFYMMPEGHEIPAGEITGMESEFIAENGLQKLGELDMGRFEARIDEMTGETIVTEDSRQSEAPQVVSNRAVSELSALFG